MKQKDLVILLGLILMNLSVLGQDEGFKRAYQHYSKVATGRTRPNLYNERGQVDANFGAPAAVCEMLLQSHLRSIDNSAKKIGDAAFNAYIQDKDSPNNFNYIVPDEKLAHAPYIIHLLPALPKAWPNGKMTGLRAHGGFVVDIEWKNGKLVQATSHANTDGAFLIYSNNTLSEVISLKKGESLTWPGKSA